MSESTRALAEKVARNNKNAVDTVAAEQRLTKQQRSEAYARAICEPDLILMNMMERTMDNNPSAVAGKLDALRASVTEYGALAAEANDEAEISAHKFVETADAALKAARDKRLAFTSECATIIKDVGGLVELLSSPDFAESIARLASLADVLERLAAADKDGWLEKMILAIGGGE